MRVGQKSVIR